MTDAQLNRRASDVRVIALISLAHGSSHFFHLILPPMFPWLKNEFAVNYAELGLLMSIFFVVSCIVQAASGFLVDKVGARPVLFSGMGLLILAALMYSQSNGYTMLVLAAIVAGCGNGIFHPVDYTLINHKISPPNLPYAYSVHGVTGYLGWAAAPAFMVAIATVTDWRIAFVAAAAGAHVAKHGGRSVSSTSGSADVLEALGVPVTTSNAEQAGQTLSELGLGFMYAPNHHAAMRHCAGVRKELGVRTLFNILGPLTNPADAPNQLLGVFSPHLTKTLAQVLQVLGSHHALVVHGSDGLDEITLSGDTRVAELKDGEVTEYTLNPRDFGIAPAPLNSMLVKNVQESRELLEMVLDNRASPALDIVVLNAGAAIYVAGLTTDLKQGVELARATIQSGAARDRLNAFSAWKPA